MAGLRQSELAALIGVSRQTISGWENGADPAPENIAAVASVLPDMADTVSDHEPDVFPPPRLVRDSGPGYTAGRDRLWAAGVRHATSEIMRTLADLLEEAEAVDTGSAAPPDRKR